MREKTAQIERFIFPKSQGQDKQKPPKMRFQWGSFVIDGVVDSVNVDLDHFAADGTPLRAKVSLAINEQNSKLIFRAVDRVQTRREGTKRVSQQWAPLAAKREWPTGLQQPLAGKACRVRCARWFGSWRMRGLSTGISGELSGDLSLEAGWRSDSTRNSVQFGTGGHAGARSGRKCFTGSFVRHRSKRRHWAGFSLSAGGGLSAALETVQAVKSRAAEQKARQAFQASDSADRLRFRLRLSAVDGDETRPAPPEQQRTPLIRTGILRGPADGSPGRGPRLHE